MRLDSNYRSFPQATTDVPAGAVPDALRDARDVRARGDIGVTDDVSGEVFRGNNRIAAPLLPPVAYEIGRRALDPATPIIDKLAKLPPARQLEYLHDLHAKDPAKFDALLSSIRAGNVSDPKVVLPASFELAASTGWGGSVEGKPVVDQLRKMYVDGKISIGPVHNDALGITRPGNEADGRVGGRGTPSTITLNPKLAGAPEALASVLAHEGLHAYQYAKGQTPLDDLQVEVGASLVGARVWSEMGPEKEKVTGTAAQAMVAQMKVEAGSYDPAKSAAENQAKMEAYTAAAYAYGYSSAGDRSRYAEGARMINDLLARPNAADILRLASDSEIRQMTGAYMAFGKANAGPFIRANLEKLIQVMDERNLWNAR